MTGFIRPDLKTWMEEINPRVSYRTKVMPNFAKSPKTEKGYIMDFLCFSLDRIGDYSNIETETFRVPVELVRQALGDYEKKLDDDDDV